MKKLYTGLLLGIVCFRVPLAQSVFVSGSDEVSWHQAAYEVPADLQARVTKQ